MDGLNVQLNKYGQAFNAGRSIFNQAIESG
jgi:hypothetical protein